MNKRSLILCLSMLALGSPTLAQGDAYPSKGIRLIVPTPPGNALDIGARILADGLSSVWKQAVYVENKGGGAGIPGMMAAKTAAADGYTILIGASAFVAINPGLYPNLPYDVQRDFVPVNALFTVGMTLLAHPESPYKSIDDVVQAAKRGPGKLSIGIGGSPGTTQHIAAEMFTRRAGIEVILIPYKGSAPAMQDLIGGQIAVSIDSVAGAAPHVKSGRVRALGVAASQRAPQLPDVPTFSEVGFKDFTASAWGGVMVPNGTPQALIDKIGSDTRKVLADPKVRERMQAAGLVVDGRGPREWTEFVQAETKKYAEIIKAANIKPL